jgi:hypothetical protein
LIEGVRSPSRPPSVGVGEWLRDHVVQRGSPEVMLWTTDE